MFFPCIHIHVFFSGYSGSSTNKTDCHDITEILLKVALNTINQTKQTLVYSLYSLNLLIFLPIYSDNSQGYPMSRFVAGLPDHQLNYEAREMACHSVDVYKQRLISML